MSARPNRTSKKFEKKEHEEKNDRWKKPHPKSSEFATHPMFVPTTASAYESPFCSMPACTSSNAGSSMPSLYATASEYGADQRMFPTASQYGMDPRLCATASDYRMDPRMYYTSSDYEPRMYSTSSDYEPRMLSTSSDYEPRMFPTSSDYDPRMFPTSSNYDPRMHHTSELYPDARPMMTSADYYDDRMNGPRIARTNAWYEHMIPGHEKGSLFKYMLNNYYPKENGILKLGADVVDCGVGAGTLMLGGRLAVSGPEMLYNYMNSSSTQRK